MIQDYIDRILAPFVCEGLTARQFARVKDPLMSGQAKGSVGALTYGMGLGGMQARRKAKPARRALNRIPMIRSTLGWMARLYTTITVPQQELWRTWAQNHPEPDGFGGTFIMSPINAFVKLNVQAMRMNGPTAVSLIPPVADLIVGMYSLAITQGLNPGEIDIDWTHSGTGLAADFNEIQEAGPFQSIGRVQVFNRFGYIRTVAGNLMTWTQGGYEEGAYYWIRVRYVQVDGQLSAWMYGQQTPTPTP